MVTSEVKECVLIKGEQAESNDLPMFRFRGSLELLFNFKCWRTFCDIKPVSIQDSSGLSWEFANHDSWREECWCSVLLLFLLLESSEIPPSFWITLVTLWDACYLIHSGLISDLVVFIVGSFLLQSVLEDA